MPRQRKPRLLFDCCINYTAQMILRAIRQASGFRPNEDIKDFVGAFPTTVANKFTSCLLKTMSEYPENSWTFTSVRDAFSPYCSRVEMKSMHMSVDVRHLLFANLDALPGLTYLQIDSCSCYDIVCYTDENDLANLTKNLKHMPKLRVLRVGVVTDAALINELMEHCPNMQKLSMTWKLRTRPTGCWETIQSVEVRYYGACADEVKFMLDNIKNLVKLTVNEFLLPGLLHRLQDSYQLTNLVVNNAYEDPNNFVRLVKHFPGLREVIVVKPGNLIPLNDLVNLKVLIIYRSTPAMISQLVEPCFTRLRHLSLGFVNNLEAALESATFLPTLSNLSLYRCMEVSVYRIAQVFANITIMHLQGCEPSDKVRIKDRCDQPFRLLEKLLVRYMGDRFTPAHLSYLLGHCLDIRELNVSENPFRFDDTLFHALILKNPMTRLRTLELNSNHLTMNILPRVVDSFGQDLIKVQISGRKLEQQMKPCVRDRIKSLLLPFELQLIIHTESFGYPSDIEEDQK